MQTIDWDVLKEVHAKLSSQGDSICSIQPLRTLCRGSGLVLSKPSRPVATQTPEFLAHMAELRKKQEQRQYDAMVHDVLTAERAAEAARHRFSSYRGQLSLGLHIVVTMAACYTFGHVAGKTVLRGRMRPEAAGALLMTVGLLVESVLFILRATAPPKHLRAAHNRASRERMEEQVRRQRREMADEAEANKKDD